jgi:hypothetical protein
MPLQRTGEDGGSIVILTHAYDTSLTPAIYPATMFGVRYSSLFTSRWMALLWCVLICLTAIGFVGTGSDHSADDDNATEQGVTPQDVATLKQELVP